MEERYIASVDLGTSKFAVCVARVQGKDIQVVYYKESPSQGIRYSYVFSPLKVEEGLRKAITEAQQELKVKIQKVIVGLPRYYVRQETASAKTERPEPEAWIKDEEIKTIKSVALESYPLRDTKTEVIYGAVAQSFSTEDSLNELESDIVGMTAEQIEGHFKVFIGNRKYSRNIDSVFSGMGISIAKKFFIPGITAKAVLKEEEMENGVALIDIGAGVSSVTIFKDKIMRFYAAIPFGGNSITRDIKTECNISFDLAENIKKAYGACMPNNLSTLGEKTIKIIDENDVPTVQVPVKYISEIITARMKEIIEALLYEIQISGYASEEKLRAGVVVTGGGADLVNSLNMIKAMSGYSVRIAYPKRFFSGEGCPGVTSTSASTTMGMILAASNDKSLNCISDAQVRIAKQAVKPVVPKPAPRPVRKPDPEPVQEPKPEPEPEPKFDVPQVRVRIPEPEPDYSSPIEETVADAQDETMNVFSGYSPEEIRKHKDEERKKRSEERKKHQFTWIKHIKKSISTGMEGLFDGMENEEV